MEAIGACVEVAEAVTLFLSLLHAHKKYPEVSINWELAAVSTLSMPHSSFTTCTVQAHGLGAYFLDGDLFLQKLYSTAPNFKQFVNNQLWPSPVLPVQLFSRRIGDHSCMTCFSVEGVQDSNRLIVKETVEASSSRHLPTTTSLAFTLLVNVGWKEIEPKMVELSRHLHLVHIINPETCFKLGVVDAEKDYHIYAQHDPEVFRLLLKTRFKLATSLHHYLHPQAVPVRRGKLHLIKGETVLLPCCVMLKENSMPIDLQVSCAVALVPHTPLRAGKKIYADQCCTHVHVNMFGPAMLPLVLTGSSNPNLQAALLADWKRYKLTLEAVAATRRTGHSDLLLVPGLQYRVVSSKSSGRKQVLQLFVFFEHMRAGRGSGSLIGENRQWAYHMDLTSVMRTGLLSLISVHSGKFYKATHSALNKLICNYASCAELRSRIERVVPAVAEAVSSIVKHSTNQQFKEKCGDLLQLKEMSEGDTVGKTLAYKLLNLAKLKLDLGPAFSEATSSNSDLLRHASTSSLQPIDQLVTESQGDYLSSPAHGQPLLQTAMIPHSLQEPEGSFETLGLAYNHSLDEDTDSEWTTMDVHIPDATTCTEMPDILSTCDKSVYSIEGESIADSDIAHTGKEGGTDFVVSDIGSFTMPMEDSATIDCEVGISNESLFNDSETFELSWSDDAMLQSQEAGLGSSQEANLSLLEEASQGPTPMPSGESSLHMEAGHSYVHQDPEAAALGEWDSFDCLEELAELECVASSANMTRIPGATATSPAVGNVQHGIISEDDFLWDIL